MDSKISLTELKYNNPGIINIGTGSDISIKELALLIKNRINYKGEIKFDFSKPNGTPRKLLNVSKINNLGWKYSISLDNGLQMLIENIEFELNKYL